jgi:hypothetical protein
LRKINYNMSYVEYFLYYCVRASKKEKWLLFAGSTCRVFVGRAQAPRGKYGVYYGRRKCVQTLIGLGICSTTRKFLYCLILETLDPPREQLVLDQSKSWYFQMRRAFLLFAWIKFCALSLQLCTYFPTTSNGIIALIFMGILLANWQKRNIYSKF